MGKSYRKEKSDDFPRKAVRKTKSKARQKQQLRGYKDLYGNIDDNAWPDEELWDD